MTDYFDGKIAIVTGAASGIGLEISKGISARGARVVLCDVDKKRLESLDASTFSCPIKKYLLDVTNLEDVIHTFTKVHQELGRIDFLFNNAGIGGTLPFAEATQAHWEKIINLNLMGVINGTTAVYPFLQQQQHGHIVNTSSISGIIPFPGQVLYNTTKYAVTGFSLSLEHELQEMNVHISVICPGVVNTRIFYKPIIGEEAPEEFVKIPEEAISVEEAVEDILRGIEEKKSIIITPQFLKPIYENYKSTGKI